MNDPVLCPYCGEEMHACYGNYDDYLGGSLGSTMCLNLKCGSRGPSVYIEWKDRRNLGDTRAAADAIFAAARNRYTPTLKPLDIGNLSKYLTMPVWTIKGWGIVGLRTGDEINYRYVVGFAHGWEWAEDVFDAGLVWPSKPTDEERAKTKWEE